MSERRRCGEERPRDFSKPKNPRRPAAQQEAMENDFLSDEGSFEFDEISHILSLSDGRTIDLNMPGLSGPKVETKNGKRWEEIKIVWQYVGDNGRAVNILLEISVGKGDARIRARLCREDLENKGKYDRPFFNNITGKGYDGLQGAMAELRESYDGITAEIDNELEKNEETEKEEPSPAPIEPIEPSKGPDRLVKPTPEIEIEPGEWTELLYAIVVIQEKKRREPGIVAEELKKFWREALEKKGYTVKPETTTKLDALIDKF